MVSVESLSHLPAILLAAALATGSLGLAGLLTLHRLSKVTGLRWFRGPRYALEASDTGVGDPVTLRDARIGVIGRPDYILEERKGARRLVPVEVKPTRRSRRLYESDRVQLGVYLVALEGTAGSRAASFGYVRYADKTFRVDLTPELRSEIARIVGEIRDARTKAVVHRSHTVPARCANCHLRHNCDESSPRVGPRRA